MLFWVVPGGCRLGIPNMATAGCMRTDIRHSSVACTTRTAIVRTECRHTGNFVRAFHAESLVDVAYRKDTGHT